ncbi:hypothetical protein [Spiroplasma syrphidicola]|uniref:hypothetical protein n=1 Tax=Spiroplasma syrphidicola TaxID=216945 RepID=UPI0011819688|nr:hypothetical protein [Spiroplasma syrphidicola]
MKYKVQNSFIDVKNSFIKEHKVFLYTSKTIFTSFKSYIYLIIIPALLSFIDLAIKSSFFHNPINHYLYPTLFFVPILSMILFTSFILFDWRKSIFIKQMNNFKITKINFLLGFINANIVASLFTIACSFLYLFIFGFITPTNDFINWILSIIDFRQILGVIFALLLSSILGTFIGVSITGTLKNIYVIQTINILIIFFMAIFGDIFLSPNDSSSVLAISIIGYFVPQKYSTWLLLYANAEMYKNFYNVYFFINSIDSYIPFSYYWQPLLGNLGFIILTFSYSCYAFSLNIKK